MSKILLTWGTIFSMNRGVNAITLSAMDLIRKNNPKHEMILYGSGSNKMVKNNKVTFYPIYTISKHRKKFDNELPDIDINMDFSEGDSFTDAYGVARFKRHIFVKEENFKQIKKNILMPQTIGPFSDANKIEALKIIERFDRLYSRDHESIKYLQDHGITSCEFCYDMAFSLEREEPRTLRDKEKTYFKGKVGLNVSGLLYSGGYTRDNQFSLKADYRKLIVAIIQFFFDIGCEVVLVPHVYGCQQVEDDLGASYSIQKIFKKNGKKIKIVKGNHNAKELKWIISNFDFFIGARMHSCIAALSTNVPSVGIAYSKKFKGVFESINKADHVVDPREQTIEEIIEHIDHLFQNKEDSKLELEKINPSVIEKIKGVIDDIL
ncbi:MAG: polysaccharide pyruvyl transferase family protein [Candidatus Omnitrophica bacterium]|nr:polysaccharide pyruvyl transferase family protein [Candidatus Omnitrophota bacterium]